MLDSRAKWIWINSDPQKCEYAVFCDKFTFNGERAVFTVAAETDYILYVNGKLASFGQFAGYPFEKYYDEIDVTELCEQGENSLRLSVRYEGVSCATHINDGAGVIFSLDIDAKIALFSSKDTLGCYDGNYVQHAPRRISPQLGHTSDMKCGTDSELIPCVEVEKTYNILPRPVKKTVRGEFVKGKLLENIEGRRIYDLGREETGYVTLKVKASAPTIVKVAYGEHIADGCVRYIIDNRDFSINFETDSGTREFTQYFLRVAARYLEVLAPDDVEIISIGVIPYLYPQIEKPFPLDDGLDKRIYDTCMRTLRLCMNNHYEDCPWREQAMYVLDSRNQMLCGYYAFEDTDFQRANLVFISKGVRADGLLELTYPAKNTPAIPFFSVMYPVAVYEYVKHTGDKSVLDEVMPTMLGIMNKMKGRIDARGLIPDLEPPYWNFHEWSDGNNGVRRPDETGEITHLILNCAFVYSAVRFKELCAMSGIEFDVDTDAIKAGIVKEFFNPDNGIFSTSTSRRESFSQLGNSFALLIGLGDWRTLEAVKNDKSLTPATLSMLGYVYDAIIAGDPDHKEYILADIRKKYGYMLDCGATSFWETIIGEADFGRAGSLCHGWSAMPLYYYNILK
ncbi:MAG: hypothetical protein IJX74_02060 [Clostridia bacterium]|nr:hypothetical protein [Clostridia bacterium]